MAWFGRSDGGKGKAGGKGGVPQAPNGRAANGVHAGDGGISAPGGLIPRPHTAHLARPESASKIEAKGSQQDESSQGVPTDAVIDSIHRLPARQGLLTIGSRAVYQVPKGFEAQIMAFELGPKRGQIFIDPLALRQAQAKQILMTLRSKLRSEGFLLENDLQVEGSVLAQLALNHAKIHGTSDLGDVNRTKSAAKERFQEWLSLAVHEGATDIHVQIVNGQGQVQLRVDGELEPLRNASKGIFTESDAIDSMSWPYNLAADKGSNSDSQWEAGKNSYCMTRPLTVGDKKVALRYQSLRGAQGPKMIARILNVDTNIKTLTYKELGYAPSQQMLLSETASTEAGFGLFAGVTGSGKTTSQKTFVETHPGNGRLAMYSIEDPVEYLMRGVHQIVLQRDLADPEGSRRLYMETVAGLMRADPDVVIVGEFRDSASAGAGQQIVETGHLALGTVHAHLLPGIIPRLTNKEIGMSRDVLTNPNMLTLLCYQALVPKVCQHCAFDAKAALQNARLVDAKSMNVTYAESHLNKVLQNVRDRFKLSTDVFRFKNPNGCKQCSNRGTRGVTVVAEMLNPDRQWLELTRAGKDYEAMVSYRMNSDHDFMSGDMTGKTVFEHTLHKALQGMVDPLQCERFDNFARFEIEPTLSGSSFK